MIEAGRSLVAEHTPVEMLEAAEGSRLLSELVNRPGKFWNGATGSGMNWRLALSDLEADGVAYGEASLTVALHGELEGIERLDGDVRRLFAAHDAKVTREGYGQMPAWFARLPAQPRKRQVRKVFVSAGVAACLAPVFGPPRGNRRSRHLDREPLAVFETPWRTAYRYDLFAGDVGHTRRCSGWPRRWTGGSG